MDITTMLDGWKGTWLYDLPAYLIAQLGILLPIGIGVLGVVAIVLGMLRYIAKGAGQYGIIEGYVGTIGAGKTTLAVQHALTLAKARNAVLLSNIPVICNEKDGGHDEQGNDRGWTETRTVGPPWRRRTEEVWHPSEHVIQHELLPMKDDGVDLGALTIRAFQLRDEQRGLVLLMDEVGVVMPARLWKDFSVALMWVLQQSRKLACEWIWTAQDPSFVDHQLRSLTSVVHYVRAYPPPSVWRRVRGKRPWVLIASAFTPTNAPRANGETSARSAEKRMGRRIVRYRRAFEGAFDTDGVVLPSKHLKGAEVLIDAVGGHDRHVIGGVANFGPLQEATPEPGRSVL